jgi:hypothetical protein
MAWLAMKVVSICQRVAARQRISRIGTGQASASTQIGMMVPSFGLVLLGVYLLLI